ncbi:hypothetical protein niasHT_032639 [Heterodera trifolii]|uniref:Ubiquitin carboxyl-terminal hydrolase n=1 Tax=Heterodera trifolii TaxID=157864 RepID=A0ABD2IS37_9BILA
MYESKLRSCLHYSKRKASLLPKYELLQRRIVFPANRQDIQLKAAFVKCAQCEEDSRLQPLLCCCMDCAAFACLAHLKAHLQSSGHNFALSTAFGELFCMKCDDFVYDRRIEKVREEQQNARRRKLGLSLKHRWNPCRTEVKLCRRSSLYVLQMNAGQNPLGLRGLVNLGNTCFMNCIIQTLLHIPMLRDYFLSDQHHCCRSGPSTVTNRELNNTCLMCELSHVFQEFYGAQVGDPFVPNRMLHLVWAHAKHLAGYEQHDAHEFLISALNILHRHSGSTSMKQNPHECKCIIDRLFTGHLQSDLTCTRCQRVSTTVDPYWDISLELLNGCRRPPTAGGSAAAVAAPSLVVAPAAVAATAVAANNNKDDGAVASADALAPSDGTTTTDTTTTTPKTDTTTITASTTAAAATSNSSANAKTNCSGGSGNFGTDGERSLDECLENFVRPENLGLHSKIKCDNCGTYEVQHKQLTLRKLPIVACFHLKRFEHMNATMKRQKIKYPVRYPEFIDLTPYTTTHRNAIASGDEQQLREGSSRRHLTSLTNRYSLFAVVNHNGSTESGHYSCYIRHQQDNWYSCNDQKITRERVDKVLASEGYLLFYCKSYIDYD